MQGGYDYRIPGWEQRLGEAVFVNIIDLGIMMYAIVWGLLFSHVTHTETFQDPFQPVPGHD